MVRGLFLSSCSGQPSGLLSSIHVLHRGFLDVDGLAFATGALWGMEGLSKGALWGMEGLSKGESSDVAGLSKGAASGVDGLSKGSSFSKEAFRGIEGLRQYSSLCDNLAKNRERGRDI